MSCAGWLFHLRAGWCGANTSVCHDVFYFRRNPAMVISTLNRMIVKPFLKIFHFYVNFSNKKTDLFKINLFLLMRVTGLEPARHSAREPNGNVTLVIE